MFSKARTRLVFQRRFEKAEPDENGTTLLEAQDLTPPMWAEVVTMQGREAVVAARLQGVVVHEFKVRYCRALADLQTTDIAVDARDADRALSIKAVRISDRRDWVWITAEEGGAL